MSNKRLIEILVVDSTPGDENVFLFDATRFGFANFTGYQAYYFDAPTQRIAVNLPYGQKGIENAERMLKWVSDNQERFQSVSLEGV